MKKIVFFIVIIFCVSFAFGQNEGIQRHFSTYNYNVVENNVSYINSDTLTDNFHNFLPEQRVSYNNLGFMNPGHPFIAAIYSEQPNSSIFWFMNNYSGIIKKHENVLYFDTRKPLTIFKFSGGAKKFDNVSVLHTQNLGSCFNFAIDYEVVNSEGHFMYNKSKVHAFSFSSAFTKRKYQSHLNIIFNKIDHNENGGIVDNNIFKKSDMRPENVDVNLHNSNNKISQLGFQYTHEYRFGKYKTDTLYQEKDTTISKVLNSNFSILHDITLDRYYRIYTDNSTDFYSNYYYGINETHDSTALRFLENKFLFSFNLKRLGKIKNLQILAGVKNKSNYYAYNVSRRPFSSNYFTGFAMLETYKGYLNGELNYCFEGREAHDLEIKSKYNQTLFNFLSFDAYFKFQLLTPDIFLNYYRSNNFRWVNEDFSKINKTSSGIDFNFNKWKLNIGTNLCMMHNYFIFDSLALPNQISRINFVADIYLKKLLKLGNFYWLNQITYQFISNRIDLPLPEFVAYSNLYFKKPMFKKNNSTHAMLLQFGVDVKFFTNIYGYAYMPATGVFYLQNNDKFGNYPNASIYLSVKIERVRAFIKASNFNSTFMPRTYYLLHNIPDNPFAVNFGISWEFYN